MASAPSPPPQPQQRTTPPATHSTGTNYQSRSGARAGGRENYGGRGDGGRGGNHARGGGGGRGGCNHSSGRGGNYPSHNRPSDGHPTPHPTTAVPYGYLPAFLPGASSMVEQLDRKLLVILRDGRHLVGILRTFDQFSNMVLQETSERRILVVPNEKNGSDAIEDNKSPATICYQTDIELGLFIVRGDNVVLLGEVDNEEEHIDEKIMFVSLEEFEQLEEEEHKRKEESGECDESINWDFDMDLVA
eukprot:CAMPEP_0172552900 /NCGR_PEP_ID=MMETSP1067-20121228/47261_1 /TAXON_ID=265564 ORGANISM="Thalassiosira punctigera, Strain Tpunct2005C2" /NCGR_SAMPLE_ID=MMETSP1067 /ASSEMBLY_ACC=CAM_ASM_000444 /LENGTH=245 /DNA_ID=CAMNT_0013340973 /DNA_START=42 /DNA_END=779 /DNA_ORIENTATION=+